MLEYPPNIHHCVDLLNAITARFHCKFNEYFLKLTPDVNLALLAPMTHPYFSSYQASTMLDHHIRMRSLLITTANSMALTETSDVTALEASAHDTYNDYFSFTQCSNNSIPTLSQSLSTTDRYESEVRKFIEDSGKDIAVLNSYWMFKQCLLGFMLCYFSPLQRSTCSALWE